MAYGQNELKSKNVTYIGRDFTELKQLLIEYTKSYFPNTYQDFNETSPGMMLLEMSAYVGDVLNFYIDQQYKEMLLPLTEERRNILNLAKSYGYKTKPISPAYVTLTVKQVIGANTDGSAKYSDASIIDKGMKVKNATNTIFETLDVIDFKISSSATPPPQITNVDATTGLPHTTDGYTLTREVKTISGETKTSSFIIGEPERFRRVTLSETNVIEVLKVIDSNNNIWYEVETLAQDKIPIEKHYTSNDNRSNAYTNLNDNSIINLPVPYSLEYIKTGKRFSVDINTDGTTSLLFGNGLLKNGQTFDSTFLAIEQQGINLPGGEQNLEDSIDPLLGDAYGTLGEAPSHTTLTVTYRVGGGIASNLPSNTLTSIDTINTLAGTTDSGITVNNAEPARGGASGETVDEIRERTIGHASTQNRCVTKSDFEARTLGMPAKFGNIAKVYCSRAGSVMSPQRQKVKNLVDRLKDLINKNYDIFDPGLQLGDKLVLMEDIKQILDADQSGGLNPQDFQSLYEVLEMAYSNTSEDDRLYTIDLYLLSYDNNKNLVSTPTIIKQNLKQYLNQHRLLTDQISMYSGYIVNFGVVFDVIAEPYDNKDQVKVRCIQAIKDYFKIEKMQFKQIIYMNDVIQLLSGVDGVRAVNYVTITQDKDYNAPAGTDSQETNVFNPGLYTTLIQSDGISTSTSGNPGYGYYYDFSEFYGQSAVAGNGIILPAYEPAVFELKNPNQNIKGLVR